MHALLLFLAFQVNPKAPKPTPNVLPCKVTKGASAIVLEKDGRQTKYAWPISTEKTVLGRLKTLPECTSASSIEVKP